MAYILGTDIGTTGTKTMLFSEDGEILAAAYKGYKIIKGSNGFAEQNPEDWWRAVVHTVRECLAGVGPAVKEDIGAIALSTQGGSMVPVGTDGIPLSMAVSWMDTRASEQCRFFSENNEKDYFYLKTGWRLSNSLNLVQIKWLKDNKANIYNEAFKFISTIEYINFKLSGVFAGDLTNAGITQLLDITSGKWDGRLMEMAGVDETRLGVLIRSGEVIGQLGKDAARELGLNPGVRVVSGGHDQYCAALGSASVNSGDVLLSTGTAWVILGVSDKPVFDTSSYFSPGRHVIEGKWGSLASVPTGGVSLEWFRRNFAVKGEDERGNTQSATFREIDSYAEKSGAGAGGVMFYPHFCGAFCPNWSCGNKGSILGLDLSHDRYHIARAVMEGVVYDVNWILETLLEKGIRIKKLKVLGGAAKSELWTRIIADVTGMQVVLPSSADAACVGAAVLAGIGAGIFTDAAEGCSRLVAVKREINPDRNTSIGYREYYKLYKQRFENLKNCYTKQLSVN